MEIFDLNALIIQSINLIIIVWVLHRFLFKPYLAFLDEEDAKRTQLEKDHAASVHIIDDAKLEARKILEASNKDAKNAAATILENARKSAEEMALEAQREAEHARQKGFADIEHERKALKEEMQQRVIDVALKMNEKLFGEKNDANVEFLKNA